MYDRLDRYAALYCLAYNYERAWKRQEGAILKVQRSWRSRQFRIMFLKGGWVRVWRKSCIDIQSWWRMVMAMEKLNERRFERFYNV